MSLFNETHHRQSKRVVLIFAGVFLIFLILIVRLFFLQIINHEKYTLLSDKNRIYTSFSLAPRGCIFDRTGQVLATSYIQYRALIDLNRFRYSLETWQKIQKTLSLPVEKTFQELRKQQNHRFGPIRLLILKDSLSWKEILQIELLSVQQPGLMISKKLVRFYPEKDTFCHIIGYVLSPQPEDVQKDKTLGIVGASIGKAGLEKTKDSSLKGQMGIQQQELNAYRQFVQILDEEKPKNGKNLYLTLSAPLQRATLNILQSIRAGCALVMDVQNGEILAMVSVPTFDPNVFIQGPSQIEWNEITKNPDHPLINKALQGLYAPGSTFKMIVALAALSAHSVQSDNTVYCPGFYEAAGRRFHCWKWRSGGHKKVNLQEALAQSCDVFFYDLTNKLTSSQILNVAKEFGLGNKTGLKDLYEASPKLPSPSIHRGQVLNLSIGQGNLLASPLQLLVMIAAIATGKLVSPRILLSSNKKNPFSRTLPFSKKHLDSIRQGLRLAVTKGTATQALTADLSIAGKTGSTQVVSMTKQERQGPITEKPYHLRDHALFVGYAPTDKPKYAVVVLVEHGESGGRTAAPLAKEILLAAQHILGKKNGTQN